MTLHPQSVDALARWSQTLDVGDPGFGPADLAAMRTGALQEAADEPREPVDRVADSGLTRADAQWYWT
jgi:hypothetical protein